MSILTIRSGQPYRITVGLDANASLAAGDYALSRADGGYTTAAVALVWSDAGSPTVAELALTEALVETVVYQVTITGHGAADVSFRAPLALEARVIGQDDPEAEAYGVDVAWIADGITPRGGLGRRAGLAAVRYDLVAAARTRRGEWFHRPDDGAGIDDQVNAPGDPGTIDAFAARLRSQWVRDERVERGGVTVTVTASEAGDGVFDVDARVRTRAVGEPLDLGTFTV